MLRLWKGKRIMSRGSLKCPRRVFCTSKAIQVILIMIPADVLLPWDDVISGSSSLSALLVETKGCCLLLLGLCECLGPQNGASTAT